MLEQAMTTASDDPIGTLVHGLVHLGAPPLEWVMRWWREDREPVAEAWRCSRDPHAMLQLQRYVHGDGSACLALAASLEGVDELIAKIRASAMGFETFGVVLWQLHLVRHLALSNRAGEALDAFAALPACVTRSATREQFLALMAATVRRVSLPPPPLSRILEVPHAA